MQWDIVRIYQDNVSGDRGVGKSLSEFFILLWNIGEQEG